MKTKVVSGYSGTFQICTETFHARYSREDLGVGMSRHKGFEHGYQVSVKWKYVGFSVFRVFGNKFDIWVFHVQKQITPT